MYDKVFSTLRLSKVGQWFKRYNSEQPAARYSVVTLLSMIHSTIYKASLDPKNRQAFLTKHPERYDRTIISLVTSTTQSWINKMLCCVRGGELFSVSRITLSKCAPEAALSLDHSLHPITLACADAPSVKLALAATQDREAKDRRRARDLRKEQLADLDTELQPPSLKRHKSEARQDAMRAERLQGDLLYPAHERHMPVPVITNTSEQPCVPSLRYGKACTLCRLNKCNKCNKSIDQLSPASQNEWKEFVHKTPNLFFNSESVKSFSPGPTLYAKPGTRFYKPKKLG